MTKFCYICNDLVHTWYQNLSQVKLKHSNVSVCTFLKRFLRTVDSNRNVEDDLNCICEQCYDKIRDYDLTRMLVIQKENALRDLFLSTEQLYVGNIVNLKTEKIEISEDPLNEPSLENIKNEVESISMDLCDTSNETGVMKQGISEDAETISESEDTNGCGNITMDSCFKQAESDEAPEENGNCSQDTSDGENGEEEEEGGEDEEGSEEIEEEDEEEGGKEVEEEGGKEDEEKDDENTIENIESDNDNDDDYDEEESNGNTLNEQMGPSTHVQQSNDFTNCPKCPICDANIRDPESHQLWHQKHPGFICQICYFECRNKTLLLKHRKLHENRSKLDCLWCSASFEESRKLRRHVRHQHNMPTECSLCAEKIPMKKFKPHLNWHQRTPGFVCRICYFKLNDLEALVSHRKLHESRPWEECVVCGKIFGKLLAIRTHMGTHIDERKLMCDLCGKVFAKRNTFQVHMNIHTNEKVWKCPRCPRKFNSATNYRLHLASVHSTARPFTCSICDMKFKRIDHCRAHERRHTENTKTEKCTICPAAYEHKFHLKQHMERKHRTESPKRTKRSK